MTEIEKTGLVLLIGFLASAAFKALFEKPDLSAFEKRTRIAISVAFIAVFSVGGSLYAHPYKKVTRQVISLLERTQDWEKADAAQIEKAAEGL